MKYIDEMKYNYFVRVALLAVALILVIPVFSGCTEATDNGNAATTTTSGATTAGGDATTAVSDIVTTDYVSSLEPYDYGSKTLNFFCYSDNDVAYNSYIDIASEGQSAELMDNAIYNRNIKVQEKYNVDFDYMYKRRGYLVSELETYTKVNDPYVDVCLFGLSYTMQAGIRGNLYLVDDVPHLDTGKPWWYENARESTSIDNSSFLLVGDLNYCAWRLTYVTYFNTDVADAHGYNDEFYDKVRSLDWTFDYFVEVASTIYNDNNGNSLYDDEDLYGIFTSTAISDALWMGAGLKFTQNDANNLPSMNFPQSFYDYYDKQLLMFGNQNFKIGSTSTTEAFCNGSGLFRISPLTEAQDKFRTTGLSYGILPLPKLNKAQTEYYAWIHQRQGDCVSFPTCAEDIEMVGKVVEDLTYWSYKITRPAYYENLLECRLARDENSSEMINLIIGHYNYDLAYLFCDSDIGLFTGQDGIIRKALINKLQIRSYLEANIGAYNSTITKIIATIQAIQ